MGNIINSNLAGVKSQVLYVLPVDTSGNAINILASGSANYVSSLNGLTGDVTLSGINNTITVAGQAIIISGSASGGGAFVHITGDTMTGPLHMAASQAIVMDGSPGQNSVWNNDTFAITQISSVGAGVTIRDTNGSGGRVNLTVLAPDAAIKLNTISSTIIHSGTQLYPSVTSTVDLGTSALHYSKLYVDGIGNGVDIFGNANVIGQITSSGMNAAVSGSNDIGSAAVPWNNLYVNNIFGTGINGAFVHITGDAMTGGLNGTSANFTSVTGTNISGTTIKAGTLTNLVSMTSPLATITTVNATNVTGTNISGTTAVVSTLNAFTSAFSPIIGGQMLTGTTAVFTNLTGTHISGTDINAQIINAGSITGTTINATRLTGTTIFQGANQVLNTVTGLGTISVISTTNGFVTISGTAGAGTGNVNGPAASTTQALAAWSGTGGTQLENTAVTLTTSSTFADTLNAFQLNLPVGTGGGNKGGIYLGTTGSFFGSAYDSIQNDNGWLTIQSNSANGSSGINIVANNGGIGFNTYSTVANTITSLYAITAPAASFTTLTGTTITGTTANLNTINNIVITSNVGNFTGLTGTTISGTTVNAAQANIVTASVGILTGTTVSVTNVTGTNISGTTITAQTVNSLQYNTTLASGNIGVGKFVTTVQAASGSSQVLNFLTHTGNCQILVSGLNAGSTLVINTIQNTSGTSTVTFGSNFAWVGGTAGILTVTGSAIDMFAIYNNGVKLMATPNQNFF